MNIYKLVISYDGTAYAGWQIQKNGLSIQALIQEALSQILQTPISIHGSGRTDAGVHASGQVAHFIYPHALDTYPLLIALNHFLPLDIRIYAVDQAPADFHARYSALAKGYHYHLHLDKTIDPFFAKYRYHLPHTINIDHLQSATQLFIGTHDFTSFSHDAHLGSAARDPVRTIEYINIISQPIPYYAGLRLEFKGNGFLYKMVRNIVGTLLDVSCGKIPIDTIPAIFAAKDRKKAGRTAPAHGLFLAEVIY